MPKYSPITNTAYIDGDDVRSSEPDTSKAGVLNNETFVVMRFSSVADRTTKFSNANITPEEGMICFMSDTKAWYGYVSGEWKRIYPATPEITSGTTAPTAPGAVGDIYFQY